MTEDIDLRTLDLRYEGLRIKNPESEARLCISIAQRGVSEPLEGVVLQGQRALLDGFKRYRCAKRLNLSSVPFTAVAEDEVGGMMKLLRRSAAKPLGIAEQAAFLNELRAVKGMSVAQMAQDLSVSSGWVSMRLQLIDGMSPTVYDKIFAGAFPIYAFMYTLRPFMRMNEENRGEIDLFVQAVSGQGLSLRQIEQLADGYFRGPESFREQIRQGHLKVCLDRFKEAAAQVQTCNEFERVFIHDLERLQKLMQQVMGKSQNARLSSPDFLAQCHLITAALLNHSTPFFQTLRSLHDRCGQA